MLIVDFQHRYVLTPVNHPDQKQKASNRKAFTTIASSRNLKPPAFTTLAEIRRGSSCLQVSIVSIPSDV
jgi:hypothetical protein